MEITNLVAFASLTGVAAFVVRARAAAPIAAAVRPVKGGNRVSQGTGLPTHGSAMDSALDRVESLSATTTDVVLPAGRHLV